MKFITCTCLSFTIFSLHRTLAPKVLLLPNNFDSNEEYQRCKTKFWSIVSGVENLIEFNLNKKSSTKLSYRNLLFKCKLSIYISHLKFLVIMTRSYHMRVSGHQLTRKYIHYASLLKLDLEENLNTSTPEPNSWALLTDLPSHCCKSNFCIRLIRIVLKGLMLLKSKGCLYKHRNFSMANPLHCQALTLINDVKY